MSHPVLCALKSFFFFFPEVSFVDIDAGGKKKSYSLRLFDLTKQGSSSHLSSHLPRASQSSSCNVKQNKQNPHPCCLLPKAARVSSETDVIGARRRKIWRGFYFEAVCRPVIPNAETTLVTSNFDCHLCPGLRSVCGHAGPLKRKLLEVLNCAGSSSSCEIMYFCPSLFFPHKVLEIIFTD